MLLPLCEQLQHHTNVPSLTIYSQEKAALDPEALDQTTIVDNLDPQEAQRLSRVRNIGIAVIFVVGNQCYSTY